MRTSRRYTWWRVLLLLLLAGGVWWLVGWWLAPKPWWVTELEVPRSETGPNTGSFINTPASVSQLDVDGRYGLVRLPGFAQRYRVVDLLERSVVAKQTMANDDIDRELRHWTHAQSHDQQRYLIVMQRQEAPDTQRANYLFTLREWNYLTGAWRIVRTYSPNESASLSINGTTLLVTERVKMPSPMLVMPPSWSNVLAGMAQVTLQHDDVAVHRVYSLPSLELRCTLKQPWMHRQGRAELSQDGAYLIVDDERLREGFTSPLVIQWGEEDPLSSKREPEVYATMPAGVRIYRTADGSPLTERQETGKYFRYVPLGHPQTLFFLTMSGKPDSVDQVYHLPSQRWLEQELYNIVPRSDTLLQGIGPTMNQHTSVYTIDRHGSLQAVGKVEGEGATLIPHGPQYLRHTESQPTLGVLHLPAAWEQWLSQWPFLAKGFTKPSQMEVVDYRTRQVLLSLRGFQTSSLYNGITDRWLYCWSEDQAKLHLVVYALPVTAWSPWWARVAGLGVLALGWWWMRRATQLRFTQH